MKIAFCLYLTIIASSPFFGEDVVAFPKQLSFSKVSVFVLDEHPLKLLSERDINAIQVVKNARFKDAQDNDSEFVLDVVVFPSFNEDLREATRKYLGEYLVLVVDRAIVLHGRIVEVIPDGRFVLPIGNFAAVEKLLSKTAGDRSEWWKQ